MFAPAQESYDAVTVWLRSSGIAPERIIKSQSMGWVTFEATVDEAENLLKVRGLGYYPHPSSLKKSFPGSGDSALCPFTPPRNNSNPTHCSYKVVLILKYLTDRVPPSHA